MYSLKQMTLAKVATGLFNVSEIRQLMYLNKVNRWQQLVRENIPANNIPITLQDEIILLMISIELEVLNWLEDHEGIFIYKQLWHFKFCWNSDGTVDRIKTADSLIHSNCLDEKMRFVLACQYWYCSDILSLFENLRESTRRSILREYFLENENRNAHEENAAEWFKMYKKRFITKSTPHRFSFRSFYWTDVSLQGRLLDHLSEEDRKSLLDDAFRKTRKTHVGRFCLSRMSTDHREQMLTRFPLKVLRIYLSWPTQSFFLDAANRVWGHLSGNDFTCLLHIIICQKITALYRDFNYMDLLQHLWYNSPNHLKEYVNGTDIYEILMDILNQRFVSQDVPRHYFLHSPNSDVNAILCDDMIWTIINQ